MTIKEKTKNAITWIERLSKTRMKQNTGELGDRKTGFCCLGFGCYINDISFLATDTYSEKFIETVGLRNEIGAFKDIVISGEGSLAELNDKAGYSFNQISKVMQKHPHEMFDEEVANGIEKHFKK